MISTNYFQKTWIIFIFLITSCVTTSKIKQISESEMLFPLGDYRHLVHLQILASNPKDGEKTFTFVSLVQIKMDSIQIAALSPFSTTLFRINENRKSGDIQVESYSDSITKFTPQIRSYYHILRLLILARRDTKSTSGLSLISQNSNGLPFEMAVSEIDGGAHFYFAHYDNQNIPDQVEIKAQHFRAQIEVSLGLE